MKSKNSIDENLFAIGDIHGCYAELCLLLEELPLTTKSTVVFLGDYIDRGPHSKEVVQTVIELKKFCNVVPLLGNHEDMFLDFLTDPGSNQAGNFIYNGGGATLASYGFENGVLDIPAHHLKFFNSLKLSYETDQFFFVHAGLPDVPLNELDETKHRNTMLWIRDRFLKSDFPWGKQIVHGHTPTEEVEITPRRINLDTGCVYDNKLTAMEFPSLKIYSIGKLETTRPTFLQESHHSPRENRKVKRFTGEIPLHLNFPFESHEFKTLNYSDLGMKIFNPHQPDKPFFQINDIIKGDLVPVSAPPNPLRFEGRVVWADNQKNRVAYGVEFQKTPFEFLQKLKL